jgi:lysophospholipase L1-like esterase
MTVPNDSYYHRSSLNRNIARQREVIIELAQQFQCPIWDFYGIMGELGSSKTWFRSGLMRDDLVHFTAKGYHLKGDLYFDAFLKWLSQMDALSDNNK